MIRDGIFYRAASLDDISGLVALDERKWESNVSAGYDKWESRMRIFPEGVRVAVDEGRVVGVSVSHIVDYPEYGYPTWGEITANGYIANHNPFGNKFYGVNLAVDSVKPKVAFNLHEHVLEELVLPRGLPWRIGYTAPFVSRYKEAHGVGSLSEEIVERLALEDPIVNRLFFKLGFKFLGVSRNYFVDDRLSDGWGVMLEIG